MANESLDGSKRNATFDHVRDESMAKIAKMQTGKAGSFGQGPPRAVPCQGGKASSGLTRLDELFYFLGKWIVPDSCRTEKPTAIAALERRSSPQRKSLRTGRC